MDIDGKALAKACGSDSTPEALKVASHLCRTQIEEFQRLAGSNDQLLVACTQEAPVFLETLDEIKTNVPDIRFTNIREKAGWSKDSTKKSPATAKMAALLAEAALDIEGTTSVNMISKGVLLILGKDETAIDAARKVASRLDITVLLETGATLTPPSLMDIPVFTGHVTNATGHLGQFQVSIEDFAPASASSRQSLVFDGPGDGTGQTGTSVCDLILDIRGATPLFTAPEKRDGYFNPDPKNPALVGDALLELVDMVGEFEKPRYINYDEATCAHASAGITGCTRCIDNCPTGAITSDEKNDRVAFDAYICAGCGTCASICPTGAAKYNLPGGDALFTRLRTIFSAYRNAGGERPEILVHDAQYGEDMIAIMARLGGGLPSNVLPFAVNEVTSIGLDFLLACAAFGAERTMLLLAPAKADEKAVLESELALADAVFDGLGYGTGHALILDNQDPDAIEKILYAIKTTSPMPAGDFLPMGRKRSVMSLALASLHAKAPNKIDVLELPAGAPFGAVLVDTDNCTLCLACVGACPTGALKDNEDKPQLSFIEEACVQCGLCKNTCPEKVISLAPRLSFLGAARTAQVIKEEEPFECIRCGKAFGTRSTIENMVKKLEQHPMFQDKGGTERLKMCNDCRVFAMAEEDEHPMAGAARPKTRTTDDYLNEREELRRLAAKDMEAKGLADTDTEGEA